MGTRARTPGRRRSSAERAARGGRRRARHPGPAFLLALALIAMTGVLLADLGRRSYSTTMDEPAGIAAAREWRFGPGVVSNFDSPVVMKLLAAAGLRETAPTHLDDETRDGRLAFPFLLGGLAVVTGLWAARLAGAFAGAAAALLTIADPTLRGHAAIVQSDVLLALCLVAAGALLDAARSRGRGRIPRALLAGGAFGVAVASKYSALPFLALFLALALVTLGPDEPRTPARLRLAPALALVIGAVALLTAFLVQEAALAGTGRDGLRAGMVRQMSGVEPGAEQTDLLRWERRLPKGAAAYLTGLAFVRTSTSKGWRINYFLGHVSGKGSPLYFPVALLVKLPTAVVLSLAAALAWAGFVVFRAPPVRRRRLLLAAGCRAFVPGVLAAGYLASAMATDVNIGVRHVLPVVPLGLVAALAAFRPLLRPSRLAKGLLVAAVLGTLLEAGVRFGREIPFGNLLVGGPGEGLRRVVSDSNAEWGERQGRLFERVRRGDLGRVGVFALDLDRDAAATVGLRLLDDARDLPGLDSVAVSVYVLDLARAAARAEREDSPTIRRMRELLVPVSREIERRTVSREAIGDEYVLYRLRPAV